MNNSNDIPINITAVKVTKFKGIHYDAGINKKHHFESPKEISEVKSSAKNFIDFSGVKIGNCTVIGKIKKITNKEKRNPNSLGWLLKCTCGKYERKYASFIKNNINNKNYACKECRDLRYIRIKEQISINNFKSILNKNYLNLVGKNYGDYKIIGFHEDLHNIHTNEYQLRLKCRCQCGYIFFTSLKKLEKHKEKHSVLCKECNHREILFDAKHFSIYGKWPERN